MTNIKKVSIIAALIGYAIGWYAKYKISKEMERACANIIEVEAKRQIARQRQKWTANESRIRPQTA